MAPVKMFVAITLDPTLTEYNEALVQWHNNTYKTKYEVTDKKQLQELLQDEVKIRAFENSNALIMEAKGFKSTVLSAINELRKYYDFVVITTRTRKTERYTREWIDRNYPGIFEKLHFAYEEEYTEEDEEDQATKAKAISTSSSSRLVKAKKIQEICHDFHIQCIIDKDLEVLKLIDLPYKIHLKDENMVFAPIDMATLSKDLKILGLKDHEKEASDEETWLKTCNDWTEVNKVLQQMTKDYDLQGDEKIPPLATRLSRYVDDLITVTSKRTINFYTKLILNKFRGQPELRLQAYDENIGILILVANNVTQKRLMTSPLDEDKKSKTLTNLSKREFTPSTVLNLTTRYMTLDTFYHRRLFRRQRSHENNARQKALPVLKIVLKRTKEYEHFLTHEKEIIA